MASTTVLENPVPALALAEREARFAALTDQVIAEREAQVRNEALSARPAPRADPPRDLD
jgi:hypothetical protein